ncbi:unnamed protein product [Adineta ricciae]|uniref:Antitoxin SocA-like Panacea domain-containing protein n=1 Tax=Adineta ricciae TaxID=249248 RepID=A0A815C8A7_ADIRI
MYVNLSEQAQISIEEQYLGNGAYGDEIKASASFDKTLFSQEELRVLEFVAKRYGKLATDEIVHVSHEETGWYANAEQKALIDYRYAFELNQGISWSYVPILGQIRSSRPAGSARKDHRVYGRAPDHRLLVPAENALQLVHLVARTPLPAQSGGSEFGSELSGEKGTNHIRRAGITHERARSIAGAHRVRALFEHGRFVG